jgi:hypothetical protein
VNAALTLTAMTAMFAAHILLMWELRGKPKREK